MPSKTTTRLGRGVGTVALALGAVVGPLAAEAGAASVVTSSSVLAPNLVSTGRTAFYSATWANQSRPTLTNTAVVVTLPTGSALVSADPAVCTVALPSGGSGPVVTCQRENLASGASLTQQLLVQVPTVMVSTSTAVTAFLKGDEQASDRDKSHADTFPAPDQPLMIVPDAADAAGGCLLSSGDTTLATRDGLSSANPLVTTIALTAPSTACVPVTAQERARTDPTEFCGAGARCTTDISSTEFIAVSGLRAPASPLQLTFTVVANSKNMTWYKDGVSVPDCLNATSLPTGLHACINSRSKPSSTSVRLGVLWQAGPDPRWTG